VTHRSTRPGGSRSFLPAWALLTACWGPLGPARADDSESFKKFQANWQKAEKAYAKKDYRQAVMYYGKVSEIVPFEPTTRYQLACCHARLGDRDRALAALEAAIQFGWDDPRRIEQADELKGLRGDPRFARLVKAATACAEETVILYAGKAVDPAKPTPLVVVLQGLGSPRCDVPCWKPAADQRGLILVFPRAPTRARSILYGWHRTGARDSRAQDYFDMPAAEKRIKEAIAAAERRFTIDRKQVLLAGFSQGGGVALRMLGGHPGDYRGAVVLCSLYQPPGVAYWQAVAKKHSVRVFAVAGKFDRLLPRTQQAVKQLRAAKVTVRYEEMEREGHEYPPDYAQRLSRAIEFVLNRKSSRR
jgi:predicted esterase